MAESCPQSLAAPQGLGGRVEEECGIGSVFGSLRRAVRDEAIQVVGDRLLDLGGEGHDNQLRFSAEP